MASTNFIEVLLVAIFTAYAVSSCVGVENYTYVCNPERFAELGLNMSQFKYCDTSLSYGVRAKDLVDRMTTEEKVLQIGHRAQGVGRIGLPPYIWWSEALHGVSNVGPGTHFDWRIPAATSFPTVILSTASFNESLWKTIGVAVSTEARAMYNYGLAGLTFWSPNINVVRDPRWGRALETPGEDPYVVGRYAVNYVRGLQDVEGQENTTDPSSRPLKVSSCCKHYAAYDLDNWFGIQRYTFDALVTEQDMVETFLRPFEMCVRDGDVSSVMCSYNRVDGIPACVDPRLLKRTIRDDWDLNGYIVSDCDSIEVMVDDSKWLNDTWEEASTQAMRAGLDLDCGSSYTTYALPALRTGKMRETDVDQALKNLYVVLLRLGFFDGSPAYAGLGKDDVCSAEHIELATEAAHEGIVLLKNLNNTLPLTTDKYKNLAVLGPHGDATAAMIGNYAGIPCGYVKPNDGLSKYAKVNFQKGCHNVKCAGTDLIPAAVTASKTADASIIFVGLDLSVEAESLDRTDLLLPGNQPNLINAVVDASKGPVILVIMSAGGLDVSFVQNNPKIAAILWAGYPGERGGQAIADVIFGQYNPGGRLPLTWYTADYVNQLPMTSMALRPIEQTQYPGRTYKFFDGPTVYTFGYGLSYSQFTYKLESSASYAITPKVRPLEHCHLMPMVAGANSPPCPAVTVDGLECDDEIDIEIMVKNDGPMDGSHVIMVYVKPPTKYAGLPIKQLVHFDRVFVPAGTSQNVKVSLNVCKSLAVVSNTAYVVVPSGEHTVVIGDGEGSISIPVHVDFSYEKMRS